MCNCTNLSRYFSADSTLVPEPRTLYDYGTAWLWAAAARKPKAADDVTDDVDKDGLYNAFVHLGLI